MDDSLAVIAQKTFSQWRIDFGPPPTLYFCKMLFFLLLKNCQSVSKQAVTVIEILSDDRFNPLMGFKVF